jgi:hypothetical protein
MISQCTRQKIDNGVLHIEVDLECMVKSMNIPIKDVKYKLSGGVLTIEVVPDLESILNNIINR